MGFGGKRRNRTHSRPAWRAVLALGCFFAPCFVALAQQPVPPPAPLPVAYAARLESGPHETRLIFTLSACVAAQTYVLDRPDRAIVDLPEVNFQIDPAAGLKPPQKRGRRARHKSLEASGLVASFRFGRLAPGKSRIVVDLGGPAEMASVTCVPAAGVYELALALTAQTEAAFRAAARAGAEKQAASAPPRAAQEPPQGAGPSAQTPGEAAKPVVVLDPGHGGIDIGAMGRDHAMEKFLVLDFAKTLAAKLREGGHYRVVLTREEDIFVPLGVRVRMARELHAELFVSLHADALAGGGASVQGATVYTVSERASDAEAARVAEHENKADSAAGVEDKEDASEVSDILFDLTRRETRAFSHVFAHSLSEYWKVAARLNKNPRRSAGFVVLKAPDVPSVLLELGYLSNDSDASDLTSPVWREKAAAQVAQAIDAFFASRQPEKGAAPAPEGVLLGGALKGTQSGGN